ncbi:MAG: hypothetical protein IKY66_03305 [Bacteroidales bacterium]|nr:hypothetical protein [Bacteroidales bacterium]
MDKDKSTRYIKAILIIIGVALLYIIALNGRYCRTGADTAIMFDKWKKEWVSPQGIIKPQ